MQSSDRPYSLSWARSPKVRAIETSDEDENATRSHLTDKVPDDAERLAQKEAYLGGTLHSLGSSSRNPGRALLLRKAHDGVEENCGLLLSTHSLMHFSR
jgi:hypothetical protein